MHIINEFFLERRVYNRIHVFSSGKTHRCLCIQNNIMVCNFIMLGMMDHKHCSFPPIKGEERM